MYRVSHYFVVFVYAPSVRMHDIRCVFVCVVTAACMV